MGIQMCICPRCAWFKGRRNCDFCNLQMVSTETTIEDIMSMSDKQQEELVDYYIKTLIKDTYDPKARKYREENEKYVFADYVPNSKPECPTCHSTNVQLISGIERGASIMGLGIFSKKINKSFKCKHCGYTW